MKKSIALVTILLGGTLFANADTAYTRPVKSTSSFEIDADGACATTTKSNKYLTFVSSDTQTTSDSLMTWGNAGDLADSYIPAVDVGKGGSWTTTLTYDIAHRTDDEVFLSAFKFTYVAFDEDGEIFYDNLSRGLEYDFSIIDTASGNVLVSSMGSKTISDESTYENNTHGVEVDNVFGTRIENDFSVIITVRATDATLGESAYYGIRNTEMSFVTYATPDTPPNVPEPTTATLSLLALAGLAARRRRK